MRRIHPLFSLLFLLALLLAGCAGGGARTAERAAEALAQARVDVAALASPEFRGRGYSGGGHERAAAYLRGRFDAIGLEPVGGAYLHAFELEADVFEAAPRLRVDGAALRLGREFLPYPSSASGETAAPVETAFVGYGLALPERGRDDFRGVAPGRVLVMEADVPDSLTADLPPPLGVRATQEARLEIADMFGAAGVVFLTDGLLFRRGGLDAPVPAFEVLRSAWPAGAPTVSFAVETRHNQAFTSYNVVGRVPGRSADSTIVVGAHYDHLGALGEAVYFPGANDNASGTALLLALAADVARRPLDDTVVFVAFSAEEQGLLGAQAFVEEPPIDLDRVRFMLNLDMVGSAEAGIVAVGGADHPALFARLDAINTRLGLGPLGRRAQAPNSDQWAFAERGIPAFFLYTNRGRQPYHHIDDRPETIEWEDFRHAYALTQAFLRAL